MRRSHLFSLENETLTTETPVEPIAEAQPPVVETSTADEAPLEEPVDSSISEDAIAPVETIVEQIEDASDVSDVLEDFSEILARGPVSEQTAEVMAIATEHFTGRIGFANPAPLPALESFSSARAKTTTRFALESMQENIKAIAAKIRAAIESALTWLKNHVRVLMDTSGKTLADAKALQKKITDSKLVATGTFESASLARSLQIGGEVPKDLLASAKATAVSLGLYLADARGKDMMARLMSDAILDIEHFDFDLGAAVRDEKLTKSKKDQHAYVTDELLGGKALERKVYGSLGVKKGAEGLAAALNTLRLVRHPDGSEANPKDSFAGVSSATLEGILDVAIDLAEAVARFRKNLEHYEQTGREALKASDDLAKKEGGSRAVSEFLSAVPRMLVKEPVEVANYALRVSKALVSYAEKALGAHAN